MTYKEQLINNTKLFEKIGKDIFNKTHPDIAKTITKRKKMVRQIVTDKFGKVNLHRRPSALKLLEKGMKDLFFGRKGIVTKQVSRLEKELAQKEIVQQNKLKNKIFIGSMPYLTIRDTNKKTEIHKNNDIIRRQLTKSNNYSLLPRKPLFKLKCIDNRMRIMNRTITSKAINGTGFERYGNLFKTQVETKSETCLEAGSSSRKKNGKKTKEKVIYNKKFCKSYTKRVIKDDYCDSVIDSPANSVIKTSTCNSPIKTIKGMALNCKTIATGINANSNPIPSSNSNTTEFKQYQVTSVLGAYSKTVNANTIVTPNNNSTEHQPLSQRSTLSRKKQINTNFYAITQSLQSRIDTFNNTSNNVETNLMTLIDSVRSKEVDATSRKPLLKANQLQTDYEMIFNRKLKRRKTVVTKESIYQKLNRASLMIDPIKTKMKQLQNCIHKLSDKQAESYADEIASKYLQTKNDNVYQENGVNYTDMICQTENKTVRDMKKRISQKIDVIMKMRHNILQQKAKLMNRYDKVNTKEDSAPLSLYPRKKLKEDDDTNEDA